LLRKSLLTGLTYPHDWGFRHPRIVALRSKGQACELVCAWKVLSLDCRLSAETAIGDYLSPNHLTLFACDSPCVSAGASLSAFRDDRPSHPSGIATCPHTARTMIAPTIAPISPAPWPGWYHPMACPRVRGNKRSCNSEQCRHNEPGRLIGSGVQKFCNQTRHDNYENGPKNTHCVLRSIPHERKSIRLVPRRRPNFSAIIADGW
jgi:hypothetical protein